ncbi:hypothetical protein IKE99_02375 [Candidatus Saccharibacteria bacterium]|nr:hypothetical protein [Candidatus Saccharibacteria bacterium]
MRVYISGISGTGMGPLALFANDAGYEVFGSDLSRGAIYEELKKAGIEVSIGEQDGEFLRKKMKEGVDWFVYTSALPEDHPELKMVREAGVKVSKRDDFTAFLVDELGLDMVAVAGTHGKTTTTAMIVWAALKLGLPASYVVGTTLGFAPSGAYRPGDRYFIYEADEYDRNFLKFHPWTSVITCVTYDHPDIYKKKRDYKAAFLQFKAQSGLVIDDADESIWKLSPDEFHLAGKARRKDARLAAGAVFSMMPFMNPGEIIDVIDEFPGVGRRFERIADGLYTDYAHHPEEITATIDVALEEAKLRGKKGVVVIYQPHQNVRQHEVRDGYQEAFLGASKVYWLPTYLVREDPRLAVISPEEFIGELKNAEVAEATELSGELAEKIRAHLKAGELVVLMTAGPADEWLRKNFKKVK